MVFAFDALRGAASGAVPVPPLEDDDEVFAHSQMLRNVDEGVRCLFGRSEYEGASCGLALQRVLMWLTASFLLSASSTVIMQGHSVPALYVAEVLIIPASAAALTNPLLMGALHAAVEALSAHTGLLLAIVVSGLLVHHSTFVHAMCLHYLAPSPVSGRDDTESYHMSSESSARSESRVDVEALLAAQAAQRGAQPVRDPSAMPSDRVKSMPEIDGRTNTPERDDVATGGSTSGAVARETLNALGGSE